jgi:SagB-type dehydrogenase family enzyme
VSAAPPPTPLAGLEGSAYERRSAWPLAPGAGIDVAEEFHEASKIAARYPGGALGPSGRWLAGDDDAPFSLGRKAMSGPGPRRPLPVPGRLPVDLAEVTARRRSWLPETSGPLPIGSLATVLALSAGGAPGRPGFRAIPSAGAMYPLDVIVVAFDVAGLAPGAYVYDPVAHGLADRPGLDPDGLLAAADTGAALPRPAALLAVVATFARSRAKYGLRGYRFALMEAGHLVQAAITAATAAGLASLPWGGFADREVDRRLELDGLERSCLYLLAISAPEEAP